MHPEASQLGKRKYIASIQILLQRVTLENHNSVATVQWKTPSVIRSEKNRSITK